MTGRTEPSPHDGHECHERIVIELCRGGEPAGDVFDGQQGPGCEAHLAVGLRIVRTPPGFTVAGPAGISDDDLANMGAQIERWEWDGTRTPSGAHRFTLRTVRVPRYS